MQTVSDCLFFRLIASVIDQQKGLRTFALIVSAHPYCARNSHATSCIDFLSSRILNILQNAPSNSVHLTSSFSCASVSNASLRVKVSKNDSNIYIFIRIVCLC